MNLMGNCPHPQALTPQALTLQKKKRGVGDMTHTSFLKEDPSNDDGTAPSSVLRPGVPFPRSPLDMFFL